MLHVYEMDELQDLYMESIRLIKEKEQVIELIHDR
jgi:hypothetical protein